MLSTNSRSLVMVSVIGQIASPSYPPVPWSPLTIAHDGLASMLPAAGGIVYNVKVGDPALGWVAEMVEPGVSIRNREPDCHRALQVYSAIGNEATVMSGSARGARGVVTGKSGRFADRVIIDFAPGVLSNLAPGDRVQVRAFGLGLTIQEAPGVRLKNICPDLLDRWGVSAKGRSLRVPVAMLAPAKLVGAGSGLDSDAGCIQLQASAGGRQIAAGLSALRLGDIVAVQDFECSYGPEYRRGAMSIGVVSHGDSVRSGHGPGLTIVMTSASGDLDPVVDPAANIGRMLQLGAFRRPPPD